MHSRVTEWDGVTATEIDRDLAYFRVVPQAEEIPGMCGTLQMVEQQMDLRRPPKVIELEVGLATLSAAPAPGLSSRT
jgi:hypothetical protein